MLKKVKKELLDVYKFRHVIYTFVVSMLKARYRRSVFGFLWTILTPLSHYIILSVVFAFAMRLQVKNFIVYLLAGLVIFNFISTVIGKSTDIFVDAEHFIKKIYVPKMTFSLNIVFYEGINFLCSIAVLFIIGWIAGQLQVNITILSTLLPIVATFLLLTGFSLLVGVGAVYIKDLKHIVPSLMLIIFYLTPVIYPESILPESAKKYMNWNLFYYYVKSFREPLVNGSLLPLSDYLIIFFSSVIVFFTGVIVIIKLGNKIIFKL